MRTPYDGKPFYCTACGEEWTSACPSLPACKLESAEAAQLRQQRKRPKTSDVAAFKPQD